MSLSDTTPEVILPHFKPEEVEALKVEHERRAQGFKGRGLFSLDEDRVRDGIQRESFWRAQPDNDHTREELAHAIFQQGRVDEALALAQNPERVAYYEMIRDAIVKDDAETCECKSDEHTVGQFPSMKHGGKMADIAQCPECKTVNIRG